MSYTLYFNLLHQSSNRIARNNITSRCSCCQTSETPYRPKLSFQIRLICSAWCSSCRFRFARCSLAKRCFSSQESWSTTNSVRFVRFRKVTVISSDTLSDEVKQNQFYYRVYIRTDSDKLNHKAGQAFEITLAVAIVAMKTCEKRCWIFWSNHSTKPKKPFVSAKLKFTYTWI